MREVMQKEDVMVESLRRCELRGGECRDRG